MKKILLTIIAFIVVCSAEITDAQNVFSTISGTENGATFSDFISTKKQVKANEFVHATHNGVVAPATLAHIN